MAEHVEIIMDVGLPGLTFGDFCKRLDDEIGYVVAHYVADYSAGLDLPDSTEWVLQNQLTPIGRLGCWVAFEDTRETDTTDVLVGFQAENCLLLVTKEAAALKVEAALQKFASLAANVALLVHSTKLLTSGESYIHTNDLLANAEADGTDIMRLDEAELQFADLALQIDHRIANVLATILDCSFE
jgi:hypothetical protein